MNDLEQCTCGILFTAPVQQDTSFFPHFDSGAHRRSLDIYTCGPCFLGLCQNCEHTRSVAGLGAWRCRCEHNIKNVGVYDEVRSQEIALLWSQWLQHGRPSEASINL